MPSLTVMIDHVAGLRENMQSVTPDPVAAALLAELAGADGIGVYLSEDRQHTQERDIRLLRQSVHSRLVLHMTAASEMVGFALDIKPDRVILVPGNGEKILAENGFDLMANSQIMFETVDTLQANGISVGVCIAPDPEQAKLAHQSHANWIQLHTGQLRLATSPTTQSQELDKIIDTVKMAHKLRLRIAVGQGLDYHLIKLFAGLAEIDEFSIGHSLIARALLVGMDAAVREMVMLIRTL